ncbi:MAG: hypothetical protein FJ403_19680 [Verrucomicrobia bacterium]|nr:hypothetical protein [Verrucomicrobiota bacterium]
MATSLIEIEGLDEEVGQNEFDVALPARAVAGFFCALNAVEQFRGGDGGDQNRLNWKQGQKSGHVEFPSLVRDQDRSVENQSHADLSGGRLRRADSI